MSSDLAALLERWATAVNVSPLGWWAAGAMLLLLLAAGYALQRRWRRLGAGGAVQSAATARRVESDRGLEAPEPAQEIGAVGRSGHEVAPGEAAGAASLVVDAPGADVEPTSAQSAPVVPPRLAERLRRTSEALVGRLGGLLSGRSLDPELFDELESLLMGADLGVRTASDLLESVRRRATSPQQVRDLLRAEILTRLERVEAPPLELGDPGSGPHVILVLGVNGSGKTTTIGKLAARFTEQGRRVLLGAADTFRAAASEQLQVWGDRVGCDVIAGKQGADPSAIAFDAVEAARARGADLVIIDTAGRLQTKKPLMEELGKLVRVIGKACPGAPHETLLVLDANTGQNAISQARLFSEVARLSGLVLTKLDGTAKGGVLVGLADELGLPVRYVGVGEAVADLRDFRAGEFVAALFD